MDALDVRSVPVPRAVQVGHLLEYQDGKGQQEQHTCPKRLIHRLSRIRQACYSPFNPGKVGAHSVSELWLLLQSGCLVFQAAIPSADVVGKPAVRRN